MSQHPFRFEGITIPLMSRIYKDVNTEGNDFDWKTYLHYYGDHLESALESGNTAIFSSFLSWSKSVGSHYSIPELRNDALTGSLLASSADFLSPEDHRQLTGFIKQCCDEASIPKPVALSVIKKNAPLGELASGYFNALINGDIKGAGELIMNAIDEGVAIKDIYLLVFQPGLREIGRLWEQNNISVGQEHFFSAGTQIIISRLYPKIFNSQRTGKRLIATAVGGEFHEIGVRMVADFFEMDGWDTWYMGANCPDSDIIKELTRQQPDILAISVTLVSHIRNARKLIEKIGAHPDLTNINLLVGGRAYVEHQELFEDIQARSALAFDAEDAVRKANHLLN